MKYQNPRDGTFREGYPQPFGPDAFAELLAFLLSADLVVPMRKVVALKDRPGQKLVALRHDVDHNLEHALKFARWEAKHGLHSTYFLLPGTWYWREPDFPAQVRQLAALGHEVGLHNNTVVMARAADGDTKVDGGALPAGFCHGAAALMRAQLADLRGLGVSVVGTAAHGDYRCAEWHIDNNDLWAAGWRPKDFELTYEAYHLHRFAHYVSDNRGRWQAPLAFVEGKQTHLLMHPCHWNADAVLP